MKVRAPKVQWGADIDLLPPVEQSRYYKRVAEAMNHAADILQQERNKLVEVAKAQEAQLVSKDQQVRAVTAQMEQLLTRTNAEKQQLSEQVVAEGRVVKQLRQTIYQLKVRLGEK